MSTLSSFLSNLATLVMSRRSRVPVTARVVVLATAFALPAHAGQVTITVGGPLGEFVPANALANTGDQVIWIWESAGHNVTSGVLPVSDGRFDSGSPLGNPSSRQFAWRPTSTGTIPFFCDLHAVNTTMYITPSGTPVADMRITEVEFAGAGDQDRVQVSNLGDASGSLGFYRLSSQSGVTTFLDVNPITLGPSERVTLHLGTDGTNTATDVFVPGAASLGNVGSLALYVPNNTTAAEGSTIPGTLTNPNYIVDYVEWGAAGQPAQPNQLVATYAGKWAAGTVVDVASLPNGGAGYSISFCGGRASHGVSSWEISTANFGASATCSTPTHKATWGQIKQLYR
jgi:plastocyanin